MDRRKKFLIEQVDIQSCEIQNYWIESLIYILDKGKFEFELHRHRRHLLKLQQYWATFSNRQAD